MTENGLLEKKIGQNLLESVSRIEPFTLRTPTDELATLLMKLSGSAAVLNQALHPKTAAQLAGAVRIMNCYYSNLIEGHHTRPREIEKALNGELTGDREHRNLLIEARAHVRVQQQIDRHYAAGTLPDPTTTDFIRFVHFEFFREMPDDFRHLEGVEVVPGEWRAELPEVAVGLHQPPSFARVPEFMAYFESQYGSLRNQGAAQVLAIPAAHHRLNYIHPFRDGNGRVSRLMSHAMMLRAGLGASGLWSISRGLARGLNDRTQYKTMMNHADTPRQSDLDGRGNLSARALREFTAWFFRVSIDQIEFMTSQFEFKSLAGRLRELVEESKELPSPSGPLLQTVLREGEVERGDAGKIMMVPERTARRIVQQLVDRRLLASDTPKGKLHLEFPQDCMEKLFPRLMGEAR
jgi:Fic family protein